MVVHASSHADTAQSLVQAAGAFLRLRLQALLGADQQTVFLTNALYLCPRCRQFAAATVAEWKRMLGDPRHQERLVADIACCTPREILALGREALYAVTGEWIGQGKLADAVGEWHERTGHAFVPSGVPVMPAYHPTYVSTNAALYLEWRKHILKWWSG
jgi:uracil-DNA glycosylase